MPASGPDPRDSARPRRSEPEPEKSGAKLDPALFAEVLRQTADELDEAEPLPERFLDGLKEAARRRPGQPFEPLPVTEELLESVLRVQFPNDSEQLRKSVARKVARVMADDPYCRARIESLWSRLRREP